MLLPANLAQKVPRYQAGLEVVRELHVASFPPPSIAAKSEQMFAALQQPLPSSNGGRGSSSIVQACIVVKPPETVMLARLASGAWVLFDSQVADAPPLSYQIAPLSHCRLHHPLIADCTTAHPSAEVIIMSPVD